MSNYGKPVRYTENGKEFDAMVFQEHALLISHLGSNNEPMVHLVFADPAKENLNLGDPRDKFIVRLDVAHASLEFTDEYKKSSGKEEFDGGRWSEFGTSPIAIWNQVRADRAARQAAADKAKNDAAQATAQQEGTAEKLAAVQAQIGAKKLDQALKDAEAELAALNKPEGGGTVQ